MHAYYVGFVLFYCCTRAHRCIFKFFYKAYQYSSRQLSCIFFASRMYVLFVHKCIAHVWLSTTTVRVIVQKSRAQSSEQTMTSAWLHHPQ